jgi:EmrB/QacA subfamily drug resistance transporter
MAERGMAVTVSGTASEDPHSTDRAPGSALSQAVGPRSKVAMGAVGVAAFGAFLAFMDSTVVNVAFPSIQTAFPHASVSTLSWVLNAYNVVFAGLLVLSGRFADLFGRRRLFKAGLLLFTVASALCAAATSIDMLIVLRAVQAIGAAMLVPASLGIVVHASSVERRTHALSVWAAAAALAAGLGPPIGGALVDLYNWRLVFLINVPLGIAAWLLTRKMVIESRAPGRRVMPDLRGALLLSLALGSVTLGIVQGGTWGWGSAATIAAFAVSAASVALTVWSSLHHRSPVLDPELLRIRGFLVSNLVTVAAGLGLYCYLLAHILWLNYVWHYSLLLAGLAVAPGAVVAALVSVPAGRLAERFGPRAVVVPGALVWCGAYVWYASRVGLQPDFVGQWLPGQVLSGIGVGATLPVASAGGLATVPAGRYATASAVNSSARQLGGVLGIAILTVFIAHPTVNTFADDVRRGWKLAAASFAVAAVVALFFGRIRESGEATATDLRAPLLHRETVPEVEAACDASPADFLDLLPTPQLEQLLSVGEEMQLAAGDVLFHAGDTGDALYVLIAGRLELRRPDGSSLDFQPRATLGELSLLTDAPRSGTVRARRDSRLIRIDRERFLKLCDALPALMSAMARGVALRLQESRPVRPPSSPQPRVVAVVGLGPDAPVDDVAAVLARSLTDRGQRVARLGPIDPDGLQRAEAEHDRVLLVGQQDTSGFTAALRQADRVVVVTRELVPRASAMDVPCDVVMVGPVPPTTAQIVGFHDRFGSRRVYAIGEDPTEWPVALRHLAVRLAGESVGLVLAGGGARSLAHLGVLAALEEGGVVVDRLAGTSMGAFIASLYATGVSAAEVDAQVFEEFVRRNPFGDYRPTLTSLARGNRGKAMLRRCLGDLRLEELPRELVVVSTDLYGRTPVYHRRGIAAEVVGASMCLPVLFPPQRLDDRVLVDGTLTDNCPVDALYEVPEGPVLAVRIGGASSRPAAERVPKLGETLMRIMQMADRGPEPESERAATITVTPDTRGVGLLEFHQIDEAREAGRRAGEAALVAWRQRGMDVETDVKICVDEPV